MFLFYSAFLLLKELAYLKEFIEKSKWDYVKLTLLYKTEYKFIYYFSNIIKFIFFSYVCYFCVWVMFLQPILFLNEALASMESYAQYIQYSAHNLYYVLVLFMNSVLLDFTMESFIIYSNSELFLYYSLGSFLRRGVRAVSFTIGAAVTVGTGVSYSPAVDIPGVNYFQIHYGRGYGFETPLDWTKGMIVQSYLKKDVMAELVEKHGYKNKVVDGNFYNDVMNNNNVVSKILKKKCTPYEQRILGLRTFWFIFF